MGRFGLLDGSFGLANCSDCRLTRTDRRSFFWPAATPDSVQNISCVFMPMISARINIIHSLEYASVKCVAFSSFTRMSSYCYLLIFRFHSVDVANQLPLISYIHNQHKSKLSSIFPFCKNNDDFSFAFFQKINRQTKTLI